MGEAYFYHLTRSTLEEALAPLLERSLQRGWRVAVRGDDGAVLEALDLALWRTPPDGFLPHGLAGGPHDDHQPVLMTTDVALANGAACLMVIGGAPVSADEVARLDRVCILFDGTDETAVEEARERWRTLTAAGAAAQYWSQADGPWRKKAEAGGA